MSAVVETQLVQCVRCGEWREPAPVGFGFTHYKANRYPNKTCRHCLRAADTERTRNRRKEKREVQQMEALQSEDRYELPSLAPLLTAEEEWITSALCRGTGLDWWTSPGKGAARSGTTAKAKAVCQGCPVRIACRALSDDIEASLPFATWTGIWAGELPGERKTRRNRRNVEQVRQAVERYIEDHSLDKATLVGGYFNMHENDGRKAFVEHLTTTFVRISEALETVDDDEGGASGEARDDRS